MNDLAGRHVNLSLRWILQEGELPHNSGEDRYIKYTLALILYILEHFLNVEVLESNFEIIPVEYGS